MEGVLEAARNGDFITAKERFDESGLSTVDIDAVDRRKRSVAHYAAEYDEAVVIEWLHRMGADLFSRDDSNKSPVEIAVLVDSKLKRKRRGDSQVLRYFKQCVLNPIQQMFFLEAGESTESVTGTGDLENLSTETLCERFPFHNNLQALHVFSSDNRLEELKFLRSRGVDMKALDDDGNSALHFASSVSVARFLVEDCGLSVDQQNTSDGHTPSHSVLQRAIMEDIDEDQAIELLEFFVSKEADMSLSSESEGLGAAELAVDLFEGGPIVLACARGKNAFGGKSLEEYIDSLGTFSSDSDSLSVASHDDKVIAEDGEDSEEDDEEALETLESIPEGDDEEEDFFVRRK